MTLIKSISGIRGTLGGRVGSGLSPLDIAKFTAAFVKLIERNEGRTGIKIVVGRDARISGFMVNQLVCGTLQAMGVQVIDIGLSTTPTVEVAVTALKADGGVILTASHNPAQWNALKLLNSKGEFISASEGAWLLDLAEKEDFEFVTIENMGTYEKQEGWIDKHIEMVLQLPLVDRHAIAAAGFKVAVDAVNSTGGLAIPALLKALGVKTVFPLYCDPNGKFPHNPEPLPEHLTDLAALVKKEKADLGFVVDPDVDRLAIIDENGNMFGEEYTLVAVTDYVLQHTPGSTVSNLSSSRALRDITKRHGQEYTASAVGEVNVVEMMKATSAIIGGEGNGGVIYPELHYGRDALVGVALFLTHLAKEAISCSELRKRYPTYAMSKNKIQLAPETDVELLLQRLAKHYEQEETTTIDGLKIDFEQGWVHLRKSNTEPIIRVYAEAETPEKAAALANQMMEVARQMS
ncbi:MAG: phosphoglucosamine mutase [Bacteroidetes bacterium]|nr:phosphoglucosamine mutase [Bacteroidota bacterium]MBU1579891.1 phosphoglucosamine mutase [Bacteroidota bacterium]MBU2557769.1 phosphoglucosamine mutase [Bacteroidota bacterium]